MLSNNTNLKNANDVFEDEVVEVATDEPIKKEYTRLLNGADFLEDVPPLEWLIDDYLPENGLFEMFGASGTYKSFMMLDMLYCISNGIYYHGKETKQGIVVYVAGESPNGVKLRINGLNKHYKGNVDNFYMLPMPSNLYVVSELEKLVNDIKAITKDKIAVVVFDTLHRNSAGAKEDSADDFAVILNNIDTYLFGISKLVGWVHHSGASDKSRGRGTTARYGGIDTQMMIDKIDKKKCLVKCTKQKEEEEFENISFELTDIELDIKDKHGENIKTIVPIKIDTPLNKEKRQNLTTQDSEVLGMLRLLIDKEGVTIDNDFKEREGIIEARMVNFESWRVEAYKVITTSGSDDEKSKREAKKKAFQRVFKKLKDVKKILFFNDNVVMVDECRFKHQHHLNNDKTEL